jgi:hypothetical protein
MSTEAANSIRAIASILSVIVTLMGLLFIYFQLRAARRAIEGQTRANIAYAEADILKSMMQYPNVRTLLDTDINLDSGSEDANRVRLVCAMYCGFFEYLLLEENFASSRSREAYLNYAKNLIKTSPAFRSYFEYRREHFSSEFGSFFDQAVRQKAQASL